MADYKQISCSMNRLTTVRCHLLQCYILYAVLNSLARLLVHASTQNLCRFIHDMIYTTHVVTFYLNRCSVPCLTSHSKGILPVTTKLNQHFHGSFLYPLIFSFLYACFLHMCIHMCLCIHIHALHQGWQVDKLFVHHDLCTNNFSTNIFSCSLTLAALPCPTIAVRQCSRHTISIACFTAQNSGKHRELLLMHTLQFNLWKKIF